MTARHLLPVTLVALALVAAAPAAAQADGQAGDTCGPVSIPCWIALVLASSVLLFAGAVIRTVILARRIRRGPASVAADLPPDLQEPAPDTRIAPASFPALHAPWPGEQDTSGANPRRRVTPSAEQIAWGEHRLWFDDGRYFFSAAAPDDDGWLPCFVVPKGHRIVIDQAGVPKLERALARRRD